MKQKIRFTRGEIFVLCALAIAVGYWVPRFLSSDPNWMMALVFGLMAAMGGALAIAIVKTMCPKDGQSSGASPDRAAGAAGNK